MNLSNTDRMNLKKLINESDCENNTDQIRQLKHSQLIKNDIKKMETLKKEYFHLSTEELTDKLRENCNFLFVNYTDIFNKIIKNEIDLTIMYKFLIVLKLIEDEKIDQHEGSAMIGKYLKDLYIDSALKHSENMSKNEPTKETQEYKSISWKEFKKMKQN